MGPPTKRRKIDPLAKRRKVEPVAQLVFDPTARQDYLTGFHKRKVQRTKQRQELAQKREKEERIEQRKEIREQRKKELEHHVAEVNALIKKQRDSSDEEEDDDDEGADAEGKSGDRSGLVWEGFGDAEGQNTVDGVDEYVDEDRYTTVTVKELDDVRNFESDEDEDGDGKGADGAVPDGGDGKGEKKQRPRKPWLKDKPESDRPKRKKKRSFRYESKLERQAERKKQRAKKTAAAIARKAG